MIGRSNVMAIAGRAIRGPALRAIAVQAREPGLDVVELLQQLAAAGG
jgi:hypothetical protein